MRPIAGVDEVGRGALAGPILAVAAVFNCENAPVKGIKDSKKFSRKEDRREVFERLLRCPNLVDFTVNYVDAKNIDNIGIDRANAWIFEQAVARLRVPFEHVIVDGDRPISTLDRSMQHVEPHADANYWPVAAASILAKEIRDQAMRELSAAYPEYDWGQNSGYGAPNHLDALKKYGRSPEHRLSFTRKYATRPGGLVVPAEDLPKPPVDKSRTLSRAAEELPRIFVALDVETANNNWSTICEIGIVRVEDGVVTDRFHSMVKPNTDWFKNSRIHGIFWHHVQNAPSFREAWLKAQPLFKGAEAVIAHNSSFDSYAIRYACEEAQVPEPSIPWECTCRMAKKLWKGLTNHKLNTVCEHLGIKLEEHHNALQDAEAAALIRLAGAGTLTTTDLAPVPNRNARGERLQLASAVDGKFAIKRTAQVPGVASGSALRKPAVAGRR
jgi:DNA polymerase III subunit epsilon